MNKKDAEWNKLDNAAKIFPPTSNKQDTKVFRFSCQLFEEVDRQALQQALDKTMEAFPMFRSILKHGFFWYYFEKTNLQPVVEPEFRPPCGPIYDSNSRNLLFEVTCFGKRINFEVYHALTDGTGALQFFRTLISQYIGSLHPELLPQILPEMEYDASAWEKNEDSFLKYYNPKQSTARTKNQKSCQLRGLRLPEGRIKIIEGVMPVKPLIALSKSYHTTLTALLVAMMMIAFAEEMPLRHKKRPVVLSIPVNLRNYFDSETARNFFGVINVGYNFSSGSGTLEEVLETVRETFARELTAKQLAARMTALSRAEHNFLARAVPLVFKDFILKSVDYFTKEDTAGTLSNLGKIEMPAVVCPFIERFDVFVSTNKLQACVCSFGEEITVSFTSAFRSTNVQKHFFRQLTEAGIPVEVQSNKLEEDED